MAQIQRCAWRVKNVSPKQPSKVGPLASPALPILMPMANMRSIAFCAIQLFWLTCLICPNRKCVRTIGLLAGRALDLHGGMRHIETLRQHLANRS